MPACAPLSPGNPMEIEVKVISYGSPAYEAQLLLRDEVLRRPLGMSIWDDDRLGEPEDTHIGAFSQGVLVGTLILTPLAGGQVKMRQVAVSPSFQGKGVGETLVRFAEQRVVEMGYGSITLHARATARGFYEKCGYGVTGDQFLEKGIPHFPMEKALTIGK